MQAAGAKLPELEQYYSLPAPIWGVIELKAAIELKDASAPNHRPPIAPVLLGAYMRREHIV